mgnify:CR=1 FL=1
MLQGKAFLITGAGGALSRALIPAFHQAGARLFLSDPRPERMAERAQAVGAKTFVADLTRLEEALALARFVEEEAPLYGVVHTVGGFAAGRFLDTDPGLYDWMLDLNLRTTFNLLKAVLPYMAKRKEGFFAAFAAGPAERALGHLRANGGIATAADGDAFIARSVNVDADGTDAAGDDRGDDPGADSESR